GALVGARHIVTAGHCVTNKGGEGESWKLDGVTISRGRNGTSVPDSIVIDEDNVPPGETIFWWTHTACTPSPLRKSEHFAIGTLPDSFGCPSFNGQCSWHFGYLADATIDDASLHHRGYPLCDPALHNGGNRIDEPCQNSQATPGFCLNYGSWSCA